MRIVTAEVNVGHRGYKIEFIYPDNMPVNNLLNIRDISRAEVVYINGETVKDRYKAPDRAMTGDEWGLFGV